MRIALLPLKTQIKKTNANMRQFVNVVQALVIEQAPDLIVLPECTFTGYLYEQDDLGRFSEPIPGPTTKQMAHYARQWRAGICFGVIERAENGIFNTAVLINAEGQIQLIQRKISEKPPYANGTRIETAQTDFGKVALLTCGDLFAERAIAQVAYDADLLLVPMARGFDRQSPDRVRWEEEERQVYQSAVARIGIPAVIVNALDVGIEEGSFGGGMVLDGAGRVLAESPHGTDMPLVYEF